VQPNESQESVSLQTQRLHVTADALVLAVRDYPRASDDFLVDNDGFQYLVVFGHELESISMLAIRVHGGKWAGDYEDLVESQF
jgi:hypothetical protein